MIFLGKGSTLEILLARHVALIVVVNVTLEHRLDFVARVAALEDFTGILQRLGTVAIFAVIIGIVIDGLPCALEITKTLGIEKAVNPLMDILRAQAGQGFTAIRMLGNLHGMSIRKLNHNLNPNLTLNPGPYSLESPP